MINDPRSGLRHMAPSKKNPNFINKGNGGFIRVTVFDFEEF